MHGQLPKLLLWELGASEIIFKNEINKAEDPAAKLLEKKQNMLSCLLIPILQPKEVLSMKLYSQSRLAEN
jgi:hypothetical protein